MAKLLCKGAFGGASSLQSFMLKKLLLPLANIPFTKRCSSNCIRSEVSNGVFRIEINNDKRKNALTWKMFEEIGNAFKEANQNPNVKITTFTGAGDYFTSGLDLANFAGVPSMSEEERVAFADENHLLIRYLFDAAIDHEKPLFVLANGPGIGLGTVILGLCDVAYATQRAFFLTPFVTIGLNPAGCSSLVFPQLLGNSRANRLMMLGERISAHEAKEFGLLTDVFEDEMFEKKCEEKIDHVLTKLNIEGMMKVKALSFDEKRKLLKERNRIECEMFRDSFLSEQFKHKIAKMFKK